jgi:hypothetical protein
MARNFLGNSDLKMLPDSLIFKLKCDPNGPSIRKESIGFRSCAVWLIRKP